MLERGRRPRREEGRKEGRKGKGKSQNLVRSYNWRKVQSVTDCTRRGLEGPESKQGPWWRREPGNREEAKVEG